VEGRMDILNNIEKAGAAWKVYMRTIKKLWRKLKAEETKGWKNYKENNEEAKKFFSAARADICHEWLESIDAAKSEFNSIIGKLVVERENKTRNAYRQYSDQWEKFLSLRDQAVEEFQILKQRELEKYRDEVEKINQKRAAKERETLDLEETKANNWKTYEEGVRENRLQFEEECRNAYWEILEEIFEGLK
jgi:hypothetical protein